MYGAKLVGVSGMTVLILGLIGMITDWANDVPRWFTIATRVAVLIGAVAVFVALAVLDRRKKDDVARRMEEVAG